MKQITSVVALFAALTIFTACDSPPSAPEAPTEVVEARGMTGPADDSYSGFPGMVFDLAVLPNGNLLVPVTHFEGGGTIQEIGRNGIEDVATLPFTGSGLNGLVPIGQRNFFATTGGLDLTVGAGLWHVSQGNTRLVADIAAFTMGHWNPEEGFADNDLASAGPYADTWKDFRCETFAAFGHGPQTNPYHLTALSGSEVLIGDAANNGLLWAKIDGSIDVVAFMDPPLDPQTGEWMVLGYVNEEGEIVGIGRGADGVVECYVEPVPTSVVIGPDGAYYVGELTGTTPGNFTGDPSPEGLARVWRIEPGVRDVVCPSADCVEVVSGLDAVIDIEFGPDGYLWVLEFERSGFLAAVAPALEIPLAGGTLKRCALGGPCTTVKDNLPVPGALTFDRSGDLWMVENVFEPTIRKVGSR